MKTISIEDIQDGMILSSDLVGNSGNIILPSGANLKASLTSRLRSWGIEEVNIEDPEDAETEEDTGLSSAEIREQLEKIFPSESNPETQEIFEAVLKFRIKKEGADA